MNKVLFVDTLTTGMNPEKCSIYRIGGIYTENGKEIERFDFKMHPFQGARISDQSLWIGKEDRTSLSKCEDYKDVFGKFLERLESYIDVRNPKDKLYIAGFNSASFDVPFIREWFRRCENERFRDYFHVQTIDIMTLSSFVLMNERSRMMDFKLDTVAASFRIITCSAESYDCVRNAKTCLDIYRTLRTRFGLEEFNDVEPSETVYKNF